MARPHLQITPLLEHITNKLQKIRTIKVFLVLDRETQKQDDFHIPPLEPLYQLMQASTAEQSNSE